MLPTTTQTKILVAMLLVLVTALTTTATLTYFIYDRTLSAQVGSRFEFIAREMKRKIEAGLDLGLPLGQLDNVNELLRQELITDDALVSLAITSAKGVILFDTERGNVGTTQPGPWLDALAQPGADANRLLQEEGRLTIPLANSFGKVVGALQVSYSKAYYDRKREETMLDLAEVTLVVLLIGGCIGVAGVQFISRPLDHAVVRLEAALRTILLRIHGNAAPVEVEAEPETEIVGFERSLLVAVSAVERAEIEIARGVQPTAGSP